MEKGQFVAEPIYKNGKGTVCGGADEATPLSGHIVACPVDGTNFANRVC